MTFNTIEEIIQDIKQGRMVIVIDDEARENEGDLIIAASSVRPEDINFMAKFGRGLICVPMEEERLKQLDLQPMIGSDNLRQRNLTDPYSTAWMISVDAAQGVTTGISAFDRCQTVKTLIGPKSKPQDFTRPGHIFPLQARIGGVLVRAGHTEACCDLMKLTGLCPVGVICEILNDDGSMARTPQLLEFSKKFGLKVCTIASLIEYRRKKESLIKRVVETQLPTEYGTFKLILYKSTTDGNSHLVLLMGEITKDTPILVRVHSGCLTGDVFGSLRCDCGWQLKKSMQMIKSESRGVILYMSQEGRGIGLENKILAYGLQDKGLDTVQANEALGFPPDLREYGIGAQILVDLGITQIRLLTNNPRKIVGLEGYGLHVVERIPIEAPVQSANKDYLKTKKEKLGHLFE